MMLGLWLTRRFADRARKRCDHQWRTVPAYFGAFHICEKCGTVR